MIYQLLFPVATEILYDDDGDVRTILRAFLMAELGDDVIGHAQYPYQGLSTGDYAKLMDSPLKLLFDPEKTIFDTMECDALYEWYKSKRDAIPEGFLSKCDSFMTRFDIARMNDGVIRRCTHSE